ncbi:MAG TPA: glycoside hydrolase family 27 protein [Candidatus Acidoferrum sp.]|jgi:alpha-galactosidase|nr:glycoside hydrolase family 27 protein [Candidatus Acidoferrum sp.]
MQCNFKHRSSFAQQLSVAFSLLLLFMAPKSLAQTSTVAATPPMGWNSWNHFAGKIDDATVRAQADAMVSSGMRDAGYVYINIDDTWQAERDAQGVIHANSRFPDMKALADYVHGKGLKLGIYSSPGPKTCAKFEGSYGHEEQDAQTYGAWGMDYLKYDLCSFGKIMEAADSPEAAHKLMVDAYEKMHKALLRTGRPMVYSLCQYGADAVWRWGASVGGNAWRTTGDISDKYSSMTQIGFGQAGLAKYAGPGHWNDPDMLEVGNGGMNLEEYRTHMSLWALLAAPLLAGNDLSAMKPETIALLTNREVLAVDQDRLGKQADRVWAEGTQEIWARPLADGSKAIGIFNRFDWPQNIEINFHEVGFKGGVKARDIWAAKDLGALPNSYKARVAPHGVVLLRVSE